MSEWQGADIFLRALAVLHETHPGARMVFLGQGSDLPHLKELARELAPGTVDFRGVVQPDQAAVALRGASAALVSIKPGLGYDFAKPTKIYAATACGTPVVFAGQGASHDLIVQEGLGWSPGYDARALATALAAAIDRGTTARPSSAHLVSWTVEHASLTSAAQRAARAVSAVLPQR
jgi:glycosyltransferase involved in cell wall biosynthesis